MLNLFLSLSILWPPPLAPAATPDAIAAFTALNADQRPATLTYDLDAMVRAILHRVGDRRFTAHQFLGYSGASFADLELYKAQLRTRAIELNRRTRRAEGKDAVTVYILGATLDGFGVGYDILHELIAAGEIKNAVVAGMASNEAITYHLEGLEKGWGDVVSPKQEIVFFKQTYTDAQGHRSWELKGFEGDESDTPKVLKELSRFANAGRMTFNVFGGGMQAFNETLEMILESRNRPQPVEIKLFLGHQPGKVKKDTGFRAADMLAFLLNHNRFLLNRRISVRAASPTLGQELSISQMNREPGFQRLTADLKVAPAKLTELRATETSPEVQAQIKYFTVLQGLVNLPLHEIEKFRVRSSLQIAEARARLMDPAAETASLIKAAVDQCVGCGDDVEAVRREYLRRNVCDESLAQ
jgi:hypothetical protein